MENVSFPPKTMTPQTLLFPFKSPPTLLRFTTSAARRLFASTATTAIVGPELVGISETPAPAPKPNGAKRGVSGRGRKAAVNAEQLKLDWLDSLSCPFQNGDETHVAEGSDCGGLGHPGWVIGVDPDIYGAVAVIDRDGCPQVHDSPHLKVLVGKRVRKRLDVKSIIQLLRAIDAPVGTTAYVEQSIPYPQDGKQGWWSGGFGYGLWIGILVASGYSVVPVPSISWKSELKLAGSRSSKDDSRELASTLFPSIGPLLKRKKDHGRAEALLIAAYGRGLKVSADSSSVLGTLTPQTHALDAT